MSTVRSFAQLLPAIFRSIPIKSPASFGSIRTFSSCSSLWSVDMEQVDTSKRLAQLRDLMKQHKVDIYG